MATVQDGKNQEHGRTGGHYRTDALNPQVTLRAVSGIKEFGLGRLSASPHDLAGLGPEFELIDGAGQMGTRLGDLGLDCVR
jgi:hypothetical protein